MMHNDKQLHGCENLTTEPRGKRKWARIPTRRVLRKPELRRGFRSLTTVKCTVIRREKRLFLEDKDEADLAGFVIDGCRQHFAYRPDAVPDCHAASAAIRPAGIDRNVSRQGRERLRETSPRGRAPNVDSQR